MNRRRILLIGGGGYLGSQLANRLASEGQDVELLVHNQEKTVPPGLPVHVGGLGNVALLRRILPSFDTVFHLASGTTPGVSARDPSLEAELNLFPTLRFLEVFQNHSQARLVFISSGGTIYGNPISSPVSEDAPLAPLSFYGAGKVALETFLTAYAHTQGGRLTILRPSNLYGPGQPHYFGFGVIRTMLQHLLDDSSMQIWGDGEAVRDFIYIDDLVEACVMSMMDPAPIGIYNVGYGTGYSIRQLVDIVRAVCHKNLQVEYRQGRKIDVRAIVLDSTRFRAATGWEPRISLETGISRTWSWLLSENTQ
ncbi:MAG: NAD-dependent epimerase/dehydratase family protein [Gammaproteobacteria bacterium]|nr:NAD-dependent epimerase/dehydratase family protein [Gammaproteobacteria bacterium]MDH3406917.1 NAD-dependent epimerase/dehydratase family protein [Gammaproteobacteria bacterium]MDH3562342.1 NAD-dependent epimerase/dehydratase family protein [Gammaproteobacteria bacterium]MDH5487335.1 NAD-dependent epimerase/dehydratase family protein [Gammaproteobacteria bacterium]